jgi:TPR repeat protein
MVAFQLNAPPTWGPPVRDTTAADRTSQVWRQLGARVEASEPAAQVRLGWHYEVGDGIRRAPDQAAYWYQRAADRGLPAAWNMLGRLLVEGRGLPRDPGRAHHLVRRAAEAGDVAAQANLGVMLLDRSPQQAAEWFERAAPTNAVAAYNLARYLEAEGGPTGRVRGLLERAAAELPEAQEALAARGTR